MPYTLDLPTEWVALPRACLTTPDRDAFVVVDPGDEGRTRLMGWRMDGFDGQTREQAYDTLEANANRPLPSGVETPLIPMTVSRVDLPVGPALEIR